MPILYLTPSSIGYLSQFILALMITAYLAHLARQAWVRGQVYLPTLLLTAAFGMMTCLILFLFLDGSLRADYRHPAVFLQSPVLDLCLAAMLQFAYYFPAPSPRQKWERRLTLLLSLLYVAWEIADTIERFADLALGKTSVRSSYADYPLAVGFVWLVLLFVRQMVRFSPGGPGAWWRALWRPSNPEAHAARGFVLVAFGALSLSLVEVVYARTPMPVATREQIYSLGLLVVLFAFALVYVNNLPQQTTFMVKIVGISLLTILAALGTLGWLSASVKMAIAYRECRVPEGQAYRFSPNPSGGFDVSLTPLRFEADMGEKVSMHNGVYDLALPFAFPFYGQTWHTTYVSKLGTLSFGDSPWRVDSRYYFAPIPAIFPLFADLDYEKAGPMGGVFILTTQDQVTISWNRLPFLDAPEKLYTFQLRLFPDGAFEVAHAFVPEHLYRLYLTRYTGWVVGASSGMLGVKPHWLRSTEQLPFSSRDEGAVVLDYYLCFREQLHQQLAPLAKLILGSSVFILVGFPFFFRPSLVRPLNALLERICQVDAGNLDTDIPVQHHDEIGAITASFNRMTTQLSDLLAHLEARVKERTREVEAARRDAEAANQAKSAFIENINHELRTPLASILVYIETLLDGNPGTLTEIQRDFLQTSYDNAQLLSRLIGDLLDAS